MCQKSDNDLQNVFPKYVCDAAAPQIGRLLTRIRWFLPKKQRASSGEHWAYTHISF